MEEPKDEKIKQEIFKAIEGILDYVNIAVPGPGYKVLRSKILRLGNDCIRSLTKKEE